MTTIKASTGPGSWPGASRPPNWEELSFLGFWSFCELQRNISYIFLVIVVVFVVVVEVAVVVRKVVILLALCRAYLGKY